MRKTILALITILAITGCNNDKIDTTFLCEEQPIIEQPIAIQEPVPCEETIYGNLSNEWMERIDTSNVKLNHYINDTEVTENLADVIDINGQLATSNPITIPEYVGQPMKHILIIEFWQTN